MSRYLLKYWWRHLLVLGVVIILINLGQWQLRRLEERRSLNRAIEAGLSQPPVELTGQPVEPETLHRRRVVVTGQFDNEAGMIIRNRPYRGRPGVELLVPLRISGSEWAVLVNRGWIPLEDREPADRRQYALEGEVTIEGIAYRSQPQPDAWLLPVDPTPGPGEARLDRWFRVDIERISQQIDDPLLPIFIEPAPNPEASQPPLRDDDLDLSEGPHLGYAVQWFSFALILVATYVGFTWQEYRREEEPTVGTSNG